MLAKVSFGSKILAHDRKGDQAPAMAGCRLESLSSRTMSTSTLTIQMLD